MLEVCNNLFSALICANGRKFILLPFIVPFGCPVINKSCFPIKPGGVGLQERLALQRQYKPQFPLNIKQLRNCGPFVKTPGFCLGDRGPFGPSGSRMGHNVEPFRSSTGYMRPPGLNMDTQELEVKENDQPEVVVENNPEEEPVKSRPGISISIPGTVWCVVQTNNGKHFFYNPTKRQSVWKMPEELKNTPDIEMLLSPKPEAAEKEEQQSVQEEPPSKKFKSTFQHFADKNSMDKRFRIIDKMQDKESMCLDYISELAKQKQESVLIEEKVKNSKDSFTNFKAKPFKWTMELSEKEKLKLYDSHVNEIHKKNQAILWSILDDMNLPLETVWSKRVRKRVQADPRYVNYTDGEEKRVADFALFMYKKKIEAKKKCQELLSATELITSETKVMLQQKSITMENIPYYIRESEQPEVVEENKPEQEPGTSRPVISTSIPGTVWCVVQTNNGKHFFYNATKCQSVWKMPEELKNRPDVEKLLSSKPEAAEKEEQQSVQEEPPSKKFKPETEVREENTNEGAQNIALGQETTVAKEVQANEQSPTLSLEVRMQQFRELLAENNISAHSTWEKELHKIVFDSRYLLLSLQERKQVFKEYVKDRAKDERQEWSRKIKEKRNLYRQLRVESNFNVSLEAEVKEEKEKSNNEITLQTVLNEKTTNAVEVQTAENVPVVSLEDRTNKFKELLAEKNVLTSSTWEKEMHKVIFDKRFTLLTPRECKQAFEEFVKDRTKVKLKKRWHINKNSKLYRFIQSLEESNKNVQLEAEMKEEKGKSNSEIAQQTVLEEKTTNAVEVQIAENMPVVSLEDRKKKFKELLAEKSVSTHLTWEREIYKVVYDKRFILLTSEERRQAFLEYVKDRADEAKENSELYRQLLEESDLGVRSTFKSFATAHSHDKRFRNINLNIRINMFKDYISELAQQEKKMVDRSIREKVRIDFMTMLSETPGIDQLTSWRHLRIKLNTDPRYKAAVINSRRQNWFYDYLKTENVKGDFMKMLSEMPGIDSSTSWSNVKNKVSSDPRYKTVSDTHQEKWFKTYLNTVKNVKNDFMKMLSEIPGIDQRTLWSDVKRKLYPDPRYKAVGSKSLRKNWFCAFLRDENLIKNDFLKMLSETPGIDQHTLWSDVRRKLYLDSRYKAVGNESLRINWFCAYMCAENDVKDDFMKMLSEIPDLDPSTNWADVKNKVSSDPRYMAVSDSHREEWFKTYLKTVKDVKGDFMKMLSEISGINPSTSWADVKNKLSSDPRYNAVSDTHQEEWFKTYLNILKEVKGDFMKMLSEIPGINPSTSWDDVKIKVSSDPRCKAVGDTQQEEFFMTYLKTLKEATSDDINKEDKSLHSSSLNETDKQGKSHGGEAIEDFKKFPFEKVTSDDIRKEEVQEKRLQPFSLKRKNASCLYHKDAAFKDFKQFLVENVKDTKNSFTTLKARFLINPRWTMELSEKEKKNLYDSHIIEMQKQNREILWSVLEEMDLPLEAEWSEVKKRVQADPRYVNYTDGEEKLDEDFALFMHKKKLKAIGEFRELLSEIKFTEIKAMLQQKSITVLGVGYHIRKDKRYTALGKKEREEIFLAFINELKEKNQTPR